MSLEDGQALQEANKTIKDIIRLLGDMSSTTKSDAEQDIDGNFELPASAEINDFILTERPPSERITLKEREVVKSPFAIADIFKLDKHTFILQNVKDKETQKRVLDERVKISQGYRGQGNDAYRMGDYNEAIVLYSRAIEHYKDNPILYNNRGLAYIQLKQYRRAIADFDYVLRKMTKTNIDTWMFRAAAYYRMGDHHNFERSLKNAKQYNIRQAEYVDDCANKLRMGLT